MSAKMKNSKWWDRSWSPVTGCTPVSAGCEHCWAKAYSIFRPITHKPGHEFSEIIYHPDRLDIPFHWRKPKRIFTCSMGDLFHEQVAYAYIGQVFAVIRDNPQHIFINLTKRPERIPDIFDYLDYGTSCGGILPNLWLGVSAENQEMAEKRIPILLQIPAAKRFVSVEPMLGMIDLKKYLPFSGDIPNTSRLIYFKKYGYVPSIDWTICGPETGPGKRPMNLDWAQSLRDQCVAAGVPFFYKPGELDGKLWHQWPEVK